MDPQRILEEKLLEVCSLGDLEMVTALVAEKHVDVNAQHAINGWTGLHWAAKRNHARIVHLLVAYGAQLGLHNDKGQTAADLATNKDVRLALGVEPNTAIEPPALPIQPNYLVHPVFPYTMPSERPSADGGPAPPSFAPHLREGGTSLSLSGGPTAAPYSHSRDAALRSDMAEEELVIKARVANVSETDFIEVELPPSNLSYCRLVDTLCQELRVEPSLVTKVRKLPNTIVRKDKDVARLTSFAELELVLTSRQAAPTPTTAPPQPRPFDIVY